MIHISLAAEKLFSLGDWTITNSFLTSLVASIAIIALFGTAARRVTLHPTGKFAQSIESIIEAILGLIEQVTHDRAKARQWFPLLATLFIFIVVNNWFGLLPVLGSIFVRTPEGAVPLFRGANADLNTTLALALISVVATQAYAIKTLGLFRHLSKYFSFNPMLLFIGFIELISEVSKMISFSFRLFGNIFAGEVLLAVISSLLPLIGPLPFLAFELFVGLVQALVFTLLTLVFLDTATTDHKAGNGHASTPALHESKTHAMAAIPLVEPQPS